MNTIARACEKLLKYRILKHNFEIWKAPVPTPLTNGSQSR